MYTWLSGSILYEGFCCQVANINKKKLLFALLQLFCLSLKRNNIDPRFWTDRKHRDIVWYWQWGGKKEERAIVIRSRQQPRQTWCGPSLLTSWGGSCGALAPLLQSLRDKLLQRVIEVSQDQRLLTLSLPLFLSLSLSLIHFSVELALRSVYTGCLPFCLSRYFVVHIMLTCLCSCLLFCSHHCLFSTIYLSFSIISINFPSSPSFSLFTSLIFHTCLSWFWK